jgi:hypothetical protein
MPKCLVHFVQDLPWIHFRHQELDSLLSSQGIDPRSAYDKDSFSDGPYLVIDLPNYDIAVHICERSILIKSICELWACKL